MNKLAPLIALALGAAALSTVALAEDGPPKGERRGPPPEAIEACASLSVGDACSFEGPRGAAEGTCEAPPEQREGPLACRPDDAPPPPDRPQE